MRRLWVGALIAAGILVLYLTAAYLYVRTEPPIPPFLTYAGPCVSAGSGKEHCGSIYAGHDSIAAVEDYLARQDWKPVHGAGGFTKARSIFPFVSGYYAQAFSPSSAQASLVATRILEIELPAIEAPSLLVVRHLGISFGHITEQ
jgi:hypothetical protein